MQEHRAAWTRCAHCGALHDCARGFDTDLAPRDDDVAICLDCGEVSFYDSSAEGGQRRPNLSEACDLARDRVVQRARAAVIIARSF